jgi:hypothetical protein
MLFLNFRFTSPFSVRKYASSISREDVRGSQGGLVPMHKGIILLFTCFIRKPVNSI